MIEAASKKRNVVQCLGNLSTSTRSFSDKKVRKKGTSYDISCDDTEIKVNCHSLCIILSTSFCLYLRNSNVLWLQYCQKKRKEFGQILIAYLSFSFIHQRKTITSQTVSVTEQ